MMYESPISVFFDRVVDDLKKQQDEHIYRAVVDVGVSVDKDELVKALNYDRGQYEKGYDDGYGAALRELIRCRECKYSCDIYGDGGCYCVRPESQTVWISEGWDFWCAAAVKEDNDE
jgi:hypothetical protein